MSMESMEKVKDKILKEANNDSRRIFEKGRYEGRDAVYKAQRLAEKMELDSRQKAEKDAEALKNGRKSVAELEARKLRLAAKQAVVANAFDTALDRLAAMDREDYTRLLAERAKEAAVQGGELLFSEKDRAEIGEKIVDLVNAGRTDAKVSLGSDTINARGGFVLRSGAVEINCTLETMVADIREEVTPQVVKALFL